MMRNSLSSPRGKTRHAEALCGYYTMCGKAFYYERDTQEASLKKPPCKSCIRALKARASENVEDVRRKLKEAVTRQDYDAQRFIDGKPF